MTSPSTRRPPAAKFRTDLFLMAVYTFITLLGCLLITSSILA